ncbi:VanZ family protein [Marichromatium bheemlicum]|uniref:VanZ family protein n=1 Tax=Marichromatium bheemlicum TaxID=365339 RepID=A0ABX1IAJ3_9GAMM|nr:VanZ family protein [Marichromatium bheemlicum]NKN34554.1 VanZ family protein [Marichromatium bheemlicum]
MLTDRDVPYRRVLAWSLRALFLVIFAVCCYFILRQTPTQNIFENSDKYFHGAAFFGMVILAYVAAMNNRKLFLSFLTAIFLLAAFSELLQTSSLLPMRTGSSGDLLSDIFGFFAGLFIVGFLSFCLFNKVNR